MNPEGTPSGRDRLRQACASIELLEPRQFLSWQPDPAFSDNGVLTERFGGTLNDKAAFNSLAVQGDGKIVALAQVQRGASWATSKLVLARYLSDGTFDPDFAGGAPLDLPFESNFYGRDVGAMELLPDGHILVAAAQWNGATQTTTVLRFNSDGSPDGTFGVAGAKALPAANALPVHDIALSPAGGIFLVGDVFDQNGRTDRALLKLHSDGTPDASFGTGGRITYPWVRQGYQGYDDSFRRGAVLPDGRLLLTFTTQDSQFSYGATVLTADGVVDPAVGTLFGKEVFLQPDGKWIKAYSSSSGLTAARAKPDGTGDWRYTGDGTQAAGDSSAEILTTALLQSDNRILLVGRYSGKIVVARFNPSGSLDEVFSPGSRLLLDTNPAALEQANAVALAPDGSIVLAGYTDDGQSALLARIAPKPLPPTGATVIDGVVTVVGTPGDDRITLTNTGAAFLVNLNGEPCRFTFTDYTNPPLISLVVHAGDGNDWITNTIATKAKAVEVHGGGGDDRLDAGQVEDLFDGGPGSDTYYGNGFTGGHYEYRYDSLWNVENPVPGNINGRVYFDLDYNTSPDAGNVGPPGILVYLDFNDNNRLDDGEPSDLTNDLGDYLIQNAPAGTWPLRLVPPAGHRPFYLDTNSIDSGNYGSVRSATNTPQNWLLIQPLPGIYGTVYNDLDQDHLRDAGEPGVAGVRLFIDANHNFRLDAGETFTHSDAEGAYGFPDLPLGSYYVRAEHNDDWLAWYGDTNTGSITLTSGWPRYDTKDHPVVPRMRVSGVVYNDRNENGVRDPGEPGIAGRYVLLDKDGTGFAFFDDPFSGTHNPYVRTDADGHFEISHAPGLYPALVYPDWLNTDPSFYRFTSPSDGRISVDVTTNHATNLEFGLHHRTEIEVTIFNDVNGDGAGSSSEAGLVGAKVYLDLNDDQTLDSNEPSFVSDGSLPQRFTDLPDGEYPIRIIPPAGFRVTRAQQPLTVRAGMIVAGYFLLASAGPAISGYVFNDSDSDGTWDDDEPPIVGGVVLKSDTGPYITIWTDASGRYEFNNLAPDHYTVRLSAEHLPWLFSTPHGQVAHVDLTAGQAESVNFGVADGFLVRGQIWHDLNGDGSIGDGSIGDQEQLLYGWVYDDVDRDGTRDPEEPFAFSFENGYELPLLPGSHRLRVEPFGFPIVSGATEHDVDLAADHPSPLNFGFRFGNSLSGVVFFDRDQDGYRDASEVGISTLVFLDYNHDGLPSTGEPSVATADDGAYSFPELPLGGVRFGVLDRGGVFTSWVRHGSDLPVDFGRHVRDVGLFSDASLSGTVSDLAGNTYLSNLRVFLDADADGVYDPTEQQTTTDHLGRYRFDGLLNGDYFVAVESPADWGISGPISHDFLIDQANRHPTGDFTAYLLPAIHGFMFEDLDGDNVLDPFEPAHAGRQLFADANLNNLHDPGEPITTADELGHFILRLPAGTYRLVELRPHGYAPGRPGQPAPPSEIITVSPNDPARTINFLSYRFGSLSGVVFNDANGNHVKDPGEAHFPNATVLLGDLTTTSDDQGIYRFDHVPVAQYYHFVQLPGPWNPASAAGYVDIETGVDRTNYDLGLRGYIRVTGKVYSNDQQWAVSKGLGNRVVFIDVDGDDLRDPDEPFTTTIPTGNYWLDTDDLRGGTVKLAPGPYRRTKLTPIQIAPGPGFHVADIQVILLTTVNGSLYVDQNRNARLDRSESGAGWRIYVDRNLNGRHDRAEPITSASSNGTFSFPDVPAGPLQFKILRSDNRPSSVQVAQRVIDGESSIHVNIPITPVGNISGRIFEDVIHEGRLDAADKPHTRALFLDLNRDRQLGRHEPRTLTAADGSFTFHNVPPGTYSVGYIKPAGWRTTTDPFQTITVETGVESTTKPFGLTRNALISGSVYQDSNANGRRDKNEKPLRNWRLWLDLDNDAVLDTNEPSALTDRSGRFLLAPVPAVRRTLRVQMKRGFSPLKPANAALKLNLSPGQILPNQLFSVRPIRA